ncbi:SDR family NAD(P)-dependent oxidoreductase [Flagellimonas flava]|uniref:NAD(P)-dependent dehydrogenase, short-chain alcohol dehydrogenase family n=1 Tax=Flagellimonas flava TaxID=570519 RepID=A0A1M5I3W7_9FLAO|nr:SDR family oxidoreductase [Allomuricauda flava]SHG23028.1 NAD(P)-dependent dehydrogenase, short-chain alcohol dehydrogenase family [Allomuricauda flava]
MDTKIALITGGSRGLGRDMALRIADRGLNVVITYHSNVSAAEETLAEIEKRGVKGIALQLDTRETSSFGEFKIRLKKELLASFDSSSFDFLVNNAGFGYHASIAETAEKDFDNLVNVHFKGVYFLTQTLLPVLNDGGGIVNISSGLARFSFPGYAAYGAMKGAVEVFTRYLAKELGERQIRANTVAPGAINTDFNKERFEQMPQVVDYIANLTALGRVGESEDIGGVVAFLCTEEARWVNGQRLEASGGMFV